MGLFKEWCRWQGTGGRLQRLSSVFPHPAERSRNFPGQLDSGGFPPRRLLEDEKSGRRFARDVLIAEDGDHLVGQSQGFRGVPVFQMGNHQVQGDEGGFIGIAVIEEGLPDVGEELAGSLVLAQAGVHSPLYPSQAEVVQRTPVRCSQLPKLREEVGRFRVAAHLREVIDEVVANAEDEARIALRIDQAVCSLQGQKGRFRFAHLNQHEGL